MNTVLSMDMSMNMSMDTSTVTSMDTVRVMGIRTGIPMMTARKK